MDPSSSTCSLGGVSPRSCSCSSETLNATANEEDELSLSSYEILYLRVPSSLAVRSRVRVHIALRSSETNTLIEIPDEENEALRWVECEWEDLVTHEIVSRSLWFTPLEEHVGHSIRVRVTPVSREQAIRGCTKEARINHIVQPPTRLWKRCMVESNRRSQPSVSNPFRVMTYNVLAPRYLALTLMDSSSDWFREWSYRWKLVLEEVDIYEPDILCFQEIGGDILDTDVRPSLEQRGFDLVAKRRTSDEENPDQSLDACVIAWKKNRFELLYDTFVELRNTARNDLHLSQNRYLLKHFYKHNIAQIAFLREIDDCSQPQSKKPGMSTSASSRFQSIDPLWDCPNLRTYLRGNQVDEALENNSVFPLVLENSSKLTDSLLLSSVDGSSSNVIGVCNTHILSNPLLADVKLWQTACIMEDLQTANVFVKKRFRLRQDPAIVFTGDFNSHPATAVYQFIVDGHCYGHRGEEAFEHVESLRDMIPHIRLEHSIPLVSAMHSLFGREPSFSNFNQGFHACLDYIFFSYQRLQLLAGLSDISLLEMSPNMVGGPNEQFPSDHIPIVVEFAFYSLNSSQCSSSLSLLR